MIEQWLRQIWDEKYPLVAEAINRYPQSGFYESPAVKTERTLKIIKYLAAAQSA